MYTVRFQLDPDEKSLIYTLYEEGRKKDPQVYDVRSSPHSPSLSA